MAFVKIINWEGGSNARYDRSKMTPEEQRMFDDEGRPLFAGAPGDGPGQWTQGLPGARGGSGPGDMGGGGGGGGSFAPNLGTYGYDVSKAKLAYDRAVARKNEGTQRLNKTMGFQRTGDKTQIDPHNQYGALQMLLGRQGGQLDDSWSAAAERGVGHKGLGAQGESSLRFTHGAETSDLGTQYQLAYKQYLQDEADALAEYELAKQMGMYDTLRDGSYDYGYSDDGDSPGEQESPYGDFGLAPRGPAYLFGGVDKKLSKPKKLALAVTKAKSPKGGGGIPKSPTGDRPLKPQPIPKPSATKAKKTSKKGGI